MLPNVVGTFYTKRFGTFCNSSAYHWTFLGFGNEINNNIRNKILERLYPTRWQINRYLLKKKN